MASSYYKPCKELDICNELIEKYWERRLKSGDGQVNVARAELALRKSLIRIEVAGKLQAK